jgi:hypothetical protein
MKTWNELKKTPSPTGEEKLIIFCVEKLHGSKVIESESAEKIYNVVCNKLGIKVRDAEDDGDDVGDEDKTEDETIDEGEEETAE